MGQIRKINGVYYIEFYARGLLYSQPAGENLEAAQKLLGLMEEKIAGAEALTVSRHIQLADFFERFLAEARAQYAGAPKSVGRFAASIRHLSAFLDEHFPHIHQLDQVTPAVMESYKAYLVKTQKPKVVNLTVLLTRDLWEFGIKLGFLNDNPSLHVRLLPWPQRPVRKQTARYALAKQVLAGRAGLGKLSRLLNVSDVSRTVYFAHLIPLSMDEMYH